MRSVKLFLAALSILGMLRLWAAPSPWDSWRFGYTNFEQGESLRERGSYTEALKFFEKARKNYMAVRSARPDWNQRVIADRLRDCDRQIAELRRLLKSSSSTVAKVSARSPVEVPVQTPVVSPSTKVSSNSHTEINTAENSQYTESQTAQENTVSAAEAAAAAKEAAAAAKEAAATIAALKRQLIEQKLTNQRLNAELQKQRKFESEIAALLRDRKIADDRYALLEKRYKALEVEIARPNDRIAVLEQQLINERLNSERLKKMNSGNEQQLKIEKENARLSTVAKNALENLLKKKNEEVLQKNQDIVVLQQQIDKLRSLQDEIAELKRVIKLRDSEIASLQKAHKDSSEKGSLENDALKRQLLLWQEERKSLEKKNSDLSSDKESLASALRSVQEKNNTLTVENSTLMMNWEKEKNAVRLNAAELSGLRERNQSLEEDVKALYKRAEDLEKRLATRNSEDFQAAAAAKDSMKQMEKDLLAAQNQLITLRSELDSAKKNHSDTERKLKSVNDENLKARAEVIAAAEKEKGLLHELGELRPLKAQLELLQRDFKALAAENRENRLLVEAAKPRQAELEKAKLRLLDNDRLKNELAKEQRLNAELKDAYNRDQNELRLLRKRAGEFEASRRRLAELEARAKEAERLQKLEQELVVLRQREVELASLKIKFGELENSLRNVNVELGVKNDNIQKYISEIADLKKKSVEVEKLQRINRELEAMLNSQNSEMDKLNKQVAVLTDQANKDVHSACRIEIEKFRSVAASVGSLNDQIQQLQNDLNNQQRKTAELLGQQNESVRQIRLKDTEIQQLRRLNRELVEFRKKSANDLLAKVDASKLSRLEDELSALNKLNAELAAERDNLAAQLENRETTEEKSVPQLQSNRSPEDLAGAGLAAENSGKTELAIWHYKQALANKKDFVPAHLRLGMIYFRRGSFAEAASHLTAAYSAEPENSQLALTTARCYIAVSRFGNAKAIIDPLLKSDPENALVLMCAGLIDAGCGAPARAEEKLLAAARIAPASSEIQLELSKLLAASITDRRREAVIAYEKARELGAAPDPELEKQLGSMLDHRRELVRFMSGAAREAEVSSDWNSAIWYYKKILEEKHPGFVPLLAFAQWKSGNPSAAKETLEFNHPSRNAMVVKFLIAYAEKDNDSAMRAAQQSVGAKIPTSWVGVNLELEKLKKLKNPSPAVKVLLKSLQANQ